MNLAQLAILTNHRNFLANLTYHRRFLQNVVKRELVTSLFTKHIRRVIPTSHICWGKKRTVKHSLWIFFTKTVLQNLQYCGQT